MNCHFLYQSLKVDNPVRLANHKDELGAFRFNFFFVKSTKSDGRGEGDESKYPYRLFHHRAEESG